MDIPYLDDALKLSGYTRDLRRDFHQHPELGFKEYRTASIVARELNSLGLEVITGVAKTGVVATLEGSRPGPVVMLRFDMDALPIDEETDAEYASLTPGVMHACGHDGHTAIGLTVA
jgi:amidohydrolase